MRILGIDTGGTYTDGVLLERDKGQVLCKTKALTTPWDLSRGMEACMDELLEGSAEGRTLGVGEEIDLVCLSTTLATNAVVEGKGGKAGLLLLGAVPDGPLPVEGYHFLSVSVDLRGTVREPLQERELADVLQEMKGRYDALAVSGYAGVRNPRLERMVKERAEQELGIPVVCGCELTDALGFHKRTVTAVLNARLIPIVRDLIAAVNLVLEKFSICAPVMLLRGDGSLMKAECAVKRPVETILSGPAASVIGARFLSGRQDCLVVDMGGTTTDVASVRNGRCRLSREGANLGGWKTRVQALEIRSYGLGGDSQICEDENGEWRIGPHRVMPYSRREAQPGFQLGIQPDCQPGLPLAVGLTPTDLLHVTGEYVRWNPAPAGAELLRLAAKRGMSAEQLAEALEQEVVHFLWECCCVPEGVTRVVGVGAPVQTWLRKLKGVVGLTVEVPPHFEVANAVGAAAGQICERSEALIRRRRADGRYYVYTERDRLVCDSIEQAQCCARNAVRGIAAEKAGWAGALDFETEDSLREILDQNGDLVECRLTAEACGYPGRAAAPEGVCLR